MTTQQTITSPGASAAIPKGTPGLFKRLMHRPLAATCVIYVGFLIAVAVFAPLIWGGQANQNAGDLLAAHQGPSWHHVLGTDTLGRDVLERLLVGTRVTLLGVTEALSVALAVGVPFGLAAGFFGGRIDRIVSAIADLAFAVPAIVIVIVVLAVFPQSMAAAMVALGLLQSPGLMRVVRAATLPVRQELYIVAAQVSGLSKGFIIARHVLPRISGAIIVQASLLAGMALLVQTGLAFLGLVVAAPAPSWGGMVADGASVIELQSWLIWPPGVMIAITVIAFGLLGDAVRDASTEVWAHPGQAVSGGRRRRSSRRTSATDQSAAHIVTGPTSPPPQDHALLSVSGLTVSIGGAAGRATALEDVRFDLQAGEILGLVGESGCGKTMTAMAILGLLPPTGYVEAGQVSFSGTELTTLGPKDLQRVRGRGIALISQEPMISLDPAFRVGQQLEEYVRRHHGLTRKAARARAIDLLKEVRLPAPEAVLSRYPHELSGGMAQRVAIARALAGSPSLLIADEPTTALDVTVQSEILELLRDLRDRTEMAILLVTHDWGVVADMCDRAVVMYAGQVVEEAELTTMFREPLHPYTEALMASDPHRANHGEKLPAIPGSVPSLGQWPDGCHFHPRCAYATAECRSQRIPIVRPDTDRETRCIHYRELAGESK